MSSERKEIFEFGNFQLDVTEHTLQRIGGSPNGGKLPEKAFQVLVLLVRRRGHLVTKEELLAAVWPDTAVEENNLDKCIHYLRHYLGDEQYIETVRKHGYRFVRRVKVVEVSGSWLPDNYRLGYTPSDLARKRVITPVLPTTTPKEEASPWMMSGLVLTLASTGFLLIVLTVIGFLYFGGSGVKLLDLRSIAVLPLKPVDTATRDELIDMGVADSLINQLGKVQNLVVRPLNATRKYADVTQDPLEAGREQNVNYVLNANYQRADGRIRVTAQLINVATGQVEQTLKSESDAGDVFVMQDAVAREIGKALVDRFAADAGTVAARRGTSNEDAYRLYLQGMYLYTKRTPQAARKSVETLDQAVQLDPDYALAWAAKAHAHRYAGNLGRDTDTHAEYRNSIDAINRALELDPNLSEAFSALCENRLYYDFDFDRAESACTRAISLDGNSAMAHEIYGRFLYHRGRFDESIAEMNRAVDLEPTSLFNQRNLGIAYYYAGWYEEAEQQFRGVIAMDESFASAYMWLRNTLEVCGKNDEAFEWLMKAQPLLGTDASRIEAYNAAYRNGGHAAALREHAKDHELYNQFYVGAILHAQTGNHDKAFELLERSYERREWGMNSLAIEPHLESLRSDARFQDLLKRVKAN